MFVNVFGKEAYLDYSMTKVHHHATHLSGLQFHCIKELQDKGITSFAPYDAKPDYNWLQRTVTEKAKLVSKEQKAETYSKQTHGFADPNLNKRYKEMQHKKIRFDQKSQDVKLSTLCRQQAMMTEEQLGMAADQKNMRKRQVEISTTLDRIRKRHRDLKNIYTSGITSTHTLMRAVDVEMTENFRAMEMYKEKTLKEAKSLEDKIQTAKDSLYKINSTPGITTAVASSMENERREVNSELEKVQTELKQFQELQKECMKAFEIMAISFEEFTTRYCITEKPYPIDIVMDGMSLMGPDGIGVHEPVFLLKVLQFFVPTEKHNGHAYKVIVVMRKDLMEKHIPTEDTVQYNHLIKQGQLVVVDREAQDELFVIHMAMFSGAVIISNRKFRDWFPKGIYDERYVHYGNANVISCPSEEDGNDIKFFPVPFRHQSDVHGLDFYGFWESLTTKAKTERGQDHYCLNIPFGDDKFNTPRTDAIRGHYKLANYWDPIHYNDLSKTYFDFLPENALDK